MDLKYGLICLYPEPLQTIRYSIAKEWLISESGGQILNNSTDTSLNDHSIDDINDGTESESSFDSKVTDESPSLDSNPMQDFDEFNHEDILNNEATDFKQTSNDDSTHDEHRDKSETRKSTQQGSAETAKIVNVKPRIGL
ncbi:8383_t:CDS:2, partial [Racocetra fulgida]